MALRDLHTQSKLSPPATDPGARVQLVPSVIRQMGGIIQGYRVVPHRRSPGTEDFQVCPNLGPLRPGARPIQLKMLKRDLGPVDGPSGIPAEKRADGIYEEEVHHADVADQQYPPASAMESAPCTGSLTKSSPPGPTAVNFTPLWTELRPHFTFPHCPGQLCG